MQVSVACFVDRHQWHHGIFLWGFLWKNTFDQAFSKEDLGRLYWSIRDNSSLSLSCEILLTFWHVQVGLWIIFNVSILQTWSIINFEITGLVKADQAMLQCIWFEWDLLLAACLCYGTIRMVNLSSQGNILPIKVEHTWQSLSPSLYFHPEILHMSDFQNIVVLSL